MSGAVSVNAIILWSGEPARVAAFYRLLGVPLEDEDHGDGHVHQACELGAVHIAVYGAEGKGRVPGRREGGGHLVGFRVPSLDAVVAALQKAGEYRELVARQVMDWGTRIVIADPDGRSVELTQE
jgi:catechol 2,3-dioxygenase-like lactoylglutathione lyase family enzyme